MLEAVDGSKDDGILGVVLPKGTTWEGGLRPGVLIYSTSNRVPYTSKLRAAVPPSTSIGSRASQLVACVYVPGVYCSTQQPRAPTAELAVAPIATGLGRSVRSALDGSWIEPGGGRDQGRQAAGVGTETVQRM